MSDDLPDRRRHRRSHRCPRCGSASINSVADVRLVDSVLDLVGRRRYVCRDCNRRFVDRPLASRDGAPTGRRHRA